MGCIASSVQILLKIFIFGIPYLLVVIGFVPVVSALAIWRLLSGALIKIQYGNVRIFKGMDCWFSYGTSHIENYVMCIYVIEGIPDFSGIKSILHDKLVKNNNRLKHYIDHKYGYSFWIKEKNFNIDDHVMKHSNLNISSRKELNEVARNLHGCSLKPGISPWCIHLIQLNRNFEDTDGKSHYAIVFVYHHSLADGHSMIYALMNAISEVKPKLPEPKRNPKLFLRDYWIFLRSLFLFPWIFTRIMLIQNVNTSDSHAMSGHRIFTMSKNFQVVTIKRIKNNTKTNYSTVLVSCVLRSLQNHFLRQNMELPPSIIISTAKSLRKSNSEQTELMNNFIVCIHEISFAKQLSAKQRLLSTNNAMTSTTNIAFELFTSTLTYMCHICPHWAGRIFFRFLTSNVYITNGGDETISRKVFGNGSEIKELSFVTCTNKPTGIVFAFMTQGQTIDVTLSMDSSLVSNEEDLKMILMDMQQEIFKLDNNNTTEK